MDATVRFYHGVLGARLVADLAAPGVPALLLRDRRAQNTIAFFEYTGHPVEEFAKPAGRARPAGDPVRPRLVQPARRGRAARRCASRLKAAGSEVTDVVDHGFIRSVYFTDPNGIALEASCWVARRHRAAGRLRRRGSVRRPRPGAGRGRAAPGRPGVLGPEDPAGLNDPVSPAPPRAQPIRIAFTKSSSDGDDQVAAQRPHAEEPARVTTWGG